MNDEPISNGRQINGGRPKTTIAVIVLCSLVALAGLGLSGWAFYDRFQQQNERRAAQRAINERLTALSLEYCREIEKLKKGERDRAIQSRRQLPETLRLLRLAPTAELRDAANRSKFETLRRYAPEPCPRRRTS